MLATGTPITAFQYWLYRARSRRGLSQESLALRAGISVPTYGRIERASTNHAIERISLRTFACLIAAIEPTPQEFEELISSIRLLADHI